MKKILLMTFLSATIGAGANIAATSQIITTSQMTNLKTTPEDLVSNILETATLDDQENFLGGPTVRLEGPGVDFVAVAMLVYWDIIFGKIETADFSNVMNRLVYAIVDANPNFTNWLLRETFKRELSKMTDDERTNFLENMDWLPHLNVKKVKFDKKNSILPAQTIQIQAKKNNKYFTDDVTIEVNLTSSFDFVKEDSEVLLFLFESDTLIEEV